VQPRGVHLGGSAVPEYRHTIFKICVVFLTTGFGSVFPKKRLELKSLKGRTKAEELGGHGGTEGAPWGDGPSLKIVIYSRRRAGTIWHACARAW
jgi:hypothetical protein